MTSKVTTYYIKSNKSYGDTCEAFKNEDKFKDSVLIFETNKNECFVATDIEELNNMFVSELNLTQVNRPIVIIHELKSWMGNLNLIQL